MNLFVFEFLYQLVLCKINSVLYVINGLGYTINTCANEVPQGSKTHNNNIIMTSDRTQKNTIVCRLHKRAYLIRGYFDKTLLNLTEHYLTRDHIALHFAK